LDRLDALRLRIYLHTSKILYLKPRIFSVDRNKGEGGLGKTNTLVSGIVHRVVPFQERHPIDEVQSLTGGSPDIGYNSVNAGGNTAYVSIQGSRPNLGVGGDEKVCLILVVY